MQLSVIIVNYNVRYFLEQALLSVRKAMKGIEGEVWVVDNNSVDGSVEMVREKFPEVRLIANTANTGFAVANNQAIRQSSGQYVLLLNPDTLVEEDTFQQCLNFAEAHPDAGAIGVKMLDGSGNFLPESKRGFPTPWVSFCKTFGLSAFFPHSRRFNGYYLGHLSPQQNHPVDVLAGAFMWMRRSALDKAGLLDEAFFMYGEDIDLSYRITQAGFQNYYLADAQIIHYKGESTKKGSLNYVRTFYQAMIIFARKHFSGRQAGFFVMMLQMAIWLRAGMTLVANWARQWWLPVADAALIFMGLLLLRDFWANYFYHDPHYFKPALVQFNFPLYTAVWVAVLWLQGAYEARYDLRRIVRALATGTLILAAIYGFLDLDYRPSRAIIALGAAWAVAALILFRALLHLREFGHLRVGKSTVKNMLIVGSDSESARVQQLLSQAGVQKNIVETTLDLRQLDELVRVFRVEEIIFCSKDLAARDILAQMTRLGPRLSYKIVPEASMSIIGSSNKNEPGELYTIDIQYNLAQPRLRRAKRVNDLLIAGTALLTFPFWVWSARKRQIFLPHLWSVLIGRATWVAYTPNVQQHTLPQLPAGVLSPLAALRNIAPTDALQERLNFLYAKDWNEWRDWEIVWLY
jgi:GT2 family glycosyltransferase